MNKEGLKKYTKKQLIAELERRGTSVMRSPKIAPRFECPECGIGLWKSDIIKRVSFCGTLGNPVTVKCCECGHEFEDWDRLP